MEDFFNKTKRKNFYCYFIVRGALGRGFAFLSSGHLALILLKRKKVFGYPTVLMWREDAGTGGKCHIK